MLRRLFISNYAIIDHLELTFAQRLTVLTGETGAGKSILIEALSLVLGERADTDVLYDKNKKCIVEAAFHVDRKQFQRFFDENNLDAEEEITLHREISPAGKSRAFINDTPVNLSQLKSLGDLLVDMHIQHETRELITASFQLALLDSLAGQTEQVRDFEKQYQSHATDLKRWEELKLQVKHDEEELDYLRFQTDELSETNLVDGEQQPLEMQLQQLEHAEEIKRLSAEIFLILKEAEPSILSQLQSMIQSFKSLGKMASGFDDLLQRVESSRIDLEDISDELEKRTAGLEVNGEQHEEIQQRLDLIYRLQKKHHVDSIASLLEVLNDLQEKSRRISVDREELELLEKKTGIVRQQLLSQAENFSAARRQQIPLIENRVNGMLDDVGMPNASIRIEHEFLPAHAINLTGVDRFRFLFSANKGSEFLDIKKVASGGELSRLMLCFKSLVAASAQLPTIIFDEIDSGISGETALKVSGLLRQLSTKHQVICITHLPQIAAKGYVHYFIFKETDRHRTYTRVKRLNEDEKIASIAKMISGEKVTAASIASAKELLN
jgi:DNA repair protein RecN (Recombination protein N)